MIKLFIISFLISIFIASTAASINDEAFVGTIENAIHYGPLKDDRDIFVSHVLLLDQKRVEGGYTRGNTTVIKLNDIRYPAYFNCEKYINAGKKYRTYWTIDNKSVSSSEALEYCRDKQILEVNIPLS